MCESSLQGRVAFGNFSSYLIAGVLARGNTAFPHVQVNVETSLIFVARRTPMLISFADWYFF